MPDMCKTLQVSFEDRTVIASNPLLQLRVFFFKGNYKKLNYLELDKCSPKFRISVEHAKTHGFISLVLA